MKRLVPLLNTSVLLFTVIKKMVFRLFIKQYISRSKICKLSTIVIIVISAILPNNGFSQNCSLLTATYSANESRCAATGSIQINATGGSGNYQYRVTGPVNTNYTSISLITGLSAGNYLVSVRDVVTACVYEKDTVNVLGNYSTPTFSMVSTGVTCINGNNGTITLTEQNFGRAPFSYKIIAPSASGVGTVSATGHFTNLLSGSYLIQLSDSCGAIQTRSINVDNYDWFINTYTVTKIGCDSIAVTINLKDSKNNTTPNPIFNGFKYGASTIPGDTTWFITNNFHYYKGNKNTVKLFVKDLCGNMKIVVWTNPTIPSVGASVSISNKACSTFTAKITNQSNLTSPDYCIYNSSNVLIACNSNGTFNNLPYGTYCIKITDNCYDTTITRCFTVTPPIPSVSLNVTIATTCSSFTATITGQSNLNNPNYCLYNASNVLLYCNSTGIFSNLAFGSYCIKVVNNPGCYDTSITRCFTVNRPLPYINSNVLITNLTCSTFTATITDTANWNSPQFCIFTPSHVLIVCNNTGIFNNLPYGSYCIDVVNSPGCYDTTITRCFTVNRPVPSVNNSVNISNKTCTDFTATVTGKNNLNSPQYCLYNNLNVLMSCNTTGIFTNIAYGSYCIKIQNDPACYDTLITRCFSVTGDILNLSGSTSKSCNTIGTTDIKVTFSSGTPSYTLKLYSPTNVLMQTVNTNATYTFYGIPFLAPPLQYKIVGTDACGKKDSTYETPNISIVNRVKSVTNKCPSAIWPNGSGDVLVDIADNNIGGSIVPVIIKKNGVSVTINATSNTGYKYTFLDLGSATYIFDTYITNCSKHVYDTLVVKPYIYPDLFGSKAYQCDNGEITINASTIGGTAPYTYEIIQSAPAFPSIVTPPQASPVFTINNGTNYSLVRLRVVDGCGNASLYDASVLPLANFLVMPDSVGCLNHSITLRVDSIANAAYTWYKRIQVNDSIVVGNGPSYYIPFITLSDTGRYFCKILVNNGCLLKIANFIMTGSCGLVLENGLTLTGVKKKEGNELFWNAGTLNDKAYSLQRSSDQLSAFQTINTDAFNNRGTNQFFDTKPLAGNNIYRLMVTTFDGKIKYSNIVLIKNTKFDIGFYPNPVINELSISFSNGNPGDYLIELNNTSGQKMNSTTFKNIQNTVIKYPRLYTVVPGIYLLTITDLASKYKQTFKVVYQ